MSVAVDTTATKETKEAPSSDSDSPTSTAIDLGLDQVEDADLGLEDDQIDNDDENVERRANGITGESATAEQRPNKKRRRVSFECADIVEFEPTVYTTSVTSGGVPVGLSLNERSRSRRRLDSFELERANERVGRQNYMEEGYLDPQEREIILNNAGCKEPVIASVEAEVNTIIQHRRESNEIDFDFMYGSSEMEGDEESEDAEANTLSYEQDGDVEEELQEDSEGEQEKCAEEELARSMELEGQPKCSETTVHPVSDDELEAASI